MSGFDQAGRWPGATVVSANQTAQPAPEASFFTGGALGSAAGAWVYAHHGWSAVLLTGMAFPALALLVWFGEFLGRPRAARETA